MAHHRWEKDRIVVPCQLVSRGLLSKSQTSGMFAGATLPEQEILTAMQYKGTLRAGARGHGRRQHEASRNEENRPVQWQAPVSPQGRAGNNPGRTGRRRKSQPQPRHGSAEQPMEELGRDTKAACTRPAHSTRSGASHGKERRRAWLEHLSVRMARRRAHSAS